MAAALEARLVIDAVDKTGSAFDKIKARVSAIEKQASVLNRTMGSVDPIARNVGAVAAQVDRASAAFARMNEAGRSISSVASTIATVDRASAGMTASVGRSSGALSKLTGELSDAQRKLAAIAEFKGANRSLNETSLAMRKAQQEARALAAAINDTPTPARSMLAAHSGALAEVRDAERAYHAQVAAAGAARTALSELGVPLNKSVPRRSVLPLLSKMPRRLCSARRRPSGMPRAPLL